MADVVVVSYRTQALALQHHPNCFALLMCSQFGLGSELDASLPGGDPSSVGTSKDAASFILSQG